MRSSTTYSLNYILLVATSGLLAIHPVIWLLNTWWDPAYASSGWLPALLVIALIIWSASSSINTRTVHRHSNWPITLIAISVVIRMVSELLGINIIAALTLSIDVYALARLARLDQRSNAMNPFWLSILFLFALPLEHVLQRVIGYGMQNLSAGIACEMLAVLSNNVSCSGVRILVNSQDVLVDLPCSGAAGMLICLTLFCTLNSLRFHRISSILIGITITLSAAIFANAMRIVFLALGIAYPNYFQGMNVMLSPLHDIIGLSSLALAILPQLWWFSITRGTGLRSHHLPRYGTRIVNSDYQGFSTTSVAGLFILAILACVLPSNPLDRSNNITAMSLPIQILGEEQSSIPLVKSEQEYFTQFGGKAQKANFGDLSVMTVSTTSPLRHLHTPEACIEGAGKVADYLGADFNYPASANYQVTNNAGQQWHVAVTYVSDNGFVSTNISEVVWHWFTSPSQAWHMVQRITPMTWTDQQRFRADNVLFTALDLAPNETNIAFSKSEFEQFTASQFL